MQHYHYNPNGEYAKRLSNAYVHAVDAAWLFGANP